MDTQESRPPLLRAPRLEDGKAVHDLIRNSPPLDVNTSYNYFLLCGHFAQTCAVGELDGRIVSFLSAYRLPERPDTLFVWQVAVDPVLRGQGMAGKMLAAVLERDACEGVTHIETTVSPSNTSSRRVFERFAEKRNAGWEESVFLSREMFGGEDHEEEILFRIGPFDRK